ncbi:glycosyltransferase family 4 protein [Sphingobacterium rhinopitheci]|nr:glycosyltransferase family 4 protein [Sphingobacterium rhinopitheci]
MKIVYSILGTYNSGGMERVLANKANFLVRKGYSIVIITTDQQNRSPYFELDRRIECIDLGINYTDSVSRNVLGKIISYFKKKSNHKEILQKKLLEIKADIVISMFDNDSSFLYKIKDGSKKILEIHFSRYKRLQYGRKGLLKWVDRYRSRNDIRDVQNYDRFVVLTNEDKTYWGDLKNIVVIPNANSFVTDKIALLENNKVLAVGRYDYQKGFDDLIKAWQIVYKSNPDWILNIYGHGPLKNKFEQMIFDSGLEDVIFLQEPTRDIENIYLTHSILAMTSRYEGLPMVLLEAQNCGLPLVSYACKCGPSDIIKDGVNGYLVAEGDINSIAQKLIHLIQDQKLRKLMGTKSKLNSASFSEHEIMKRWTSLFDDLLY